MKTSCDAISCQYRRPCLPSRKPPLACVSSCAVPMSGNGDSVHEGVTRLTFRAREFEALAPTRCGGQAIRASSLESIGHSQLPGRDTTRL